MIENVFRKSFSNQRHFGSTMNRYIFIGVVVLGISVAVTDAQSKQCRDGKTWSTNDWACGSVAHTMCRYKSQYPSQSCNQVRVYGLTPQQKRAIVDTHNKLRAKIASGNERRGRPGPQPAGDIPPLKWDNGLAVLAQTWANQCKFGHDGCSHTDMYAVGQNVAYQFEGDLTDMIQRWYDEVKLFNRNNVANYKFNRGIGHYSQIVWGKTTSIGCGYIEYLDKSTPYGYRQYLVCDYGPSGNYEGERVY